MKPHLDIFAGNLKQSLVPTVFGENPAPLNVYYICEDCKWEIPKPDRYWQFEWFYCPVCGKETIHKDARLK